MSDIDRLKKAEAEVDQARAERDRAWVKLDKAGAELQSLRNAEMETEPGAEFDVYAKILRVQELVKEEKQHGGPGDRVWEILDILNELDIRRHRCEKGLREQIVVLEKDNELLRTAERLRILDDKLKAIKATQAMTGKVLHDYRCALLANPRLFEFAFDFEGENSGDYTEWVSSLALAMADKILGLAPEPDCAPDCNCHALAAEEQGEPEQEERVSIRSRRHKYGSLGRSARGVLGPDPDPDALKELLRPAQEQDTQPEPDGGGEGSI